MSLQSNVSGLFAHWRTITGGYDSNATRLTDYSGNGNHLPLLSGTPDFAQTKGGFTGFKMHGDAYFGSDSSGTKQFQLPPAFTIILALHTNLNAGDTFYPFYGTIRTYPSTNDPKWAAPSDSFTTNLATALIAPRLFSTNARFGDLSFGYIDVPFTNNQWNVFQFVMDPMQDGLRKGRVNTGSWVTTTVTSQNRHMLFNDEFRLGHMATPPIVTASGESLTSAQVAIYTGDVTSNPNYGTLISGMVSNPGA